MLERDWNRIIWKEGYLDPATAMIGTYDKSKQSCKEDSVDLSTGYNAVISTLRLDDYPGACAAGMGGFRGPPTTTTVPHDEDGGGWKYQAQYHDIHRLCSTQS
jgi:hypothetical protein